VRLTVLATGATAAVLLLVLFGVFVVFSHQLDTAVDSSLRIRAGDLAAAISQSGPTVVRQEELSELYKIDGTVLASSETVRAGSPLLPADADIRCPGSDVLVRSTARLATSTTTRPLRVLARCLPDGQVLAVAVSVEQQHDARDRLLLLLFVAAPVLLAGAALTLWRAVRAALRPVDDLTRQAQQISAGDDATLQMPVSRREDEISRLAQTLQDMLARLSVAFSREQAFVEDASHELRTPLAVLRGEIELALSDLADRAGVEVSLRAALAEAERLSRLAQDLLELARWRTAAEHQTQILDLGGFLTAFARRVEPVFSVRVRVTCTDGLLLRTDSDRLERIVTNLVANAAAAHATTVVLTAQPAGLGQQDKAATGPPVSLLVEDDGPGFPPQFLPTAFERFSRADAARTRTTGSGLGLAVVQALVTKLGGTVTADNHSALGGAAIRVYLPAGERKPAPPG
jgi:two-component system OmpR family sensor kinase